MTSKTPLLPLVAGLLGCSAETADYSAPPSHIAAMVAELRSRPRGRWGSEERTHPLPVASSWTNGGERRDFQGYTTQWQLGLMLDGHYVMPTIPMQEPGSKVYGSHELREAVSLLRRVAAPISWRSNQPFNEILDAPYRSLGPDDNPRAYVLDEDGTPVFSSLLSPWAANWPWYEIGRTYATTASALNLYELYPDPPFVIYLDNNEAWKTVDAWRAREQDARLERYGPPDEVTLDLVKSLRSYGLACLFRSYLDGVRAGMPDAWREVTVAVPYEGILNIAGFDYRNRGAEKEAELLRKSEFNPLDGSWDWEPMAWDGSSPPYYLNDWDKRSWDFNVRGPRIWTMNMHAVGQRAAFEVNPDYFTELSVWDGNYAASASGEKRDQYEGIGQIWSAERYKGFVRWGMWISRPQVVREFRASQTPVADCEAETMALIAAVDEVWENPVLEKFWRNSELLVNESRLHPLWRGPAGYEDVPRMFLLEASTHPELRYEDDSVYSRWGLTKIPVWALARRLGDEVLIYASAPLGLVDSSTITVPGFGDVVLADVPVGGKFWLLSGGQTVWAQE